MIRYKRRKKLNSGVISEMHKCLKSCLSRILPAVRFAGAAEAAAAVVAFSS